jgi:excisionase family DNA binding protein
MPGDRALLDELIRLNSATIAHLEQIRKILTGTADPFPDEPGPAVRRVTLISVREAAELLRINRSAVRTLLAKDRLEGWQGRNGRWSVSKEDVRRLRDRWDAQGRD